MGLELNDTTAYTEKDLTSLCSLIAYMADKGRRVNIRLDLGAGSNLLTSSHSSYKIQAKLTRIDDSIIVVYNNIIIKASGKDSLIYNFSKPIYLQEGEVITVWVQSFNAEDDSIDGYVYYTPVN